MRAGSALYLHAVDTLIYDAYTLYNLLGSYNYDTLDCKSAPAGALQNLDEATYNDYTSRLADPSNYAVSGAVTDYTWTAT